MFVKKPFQLRTSLFIFASVVLFSCGSPTQPESNDGNAAKDSLTEPAQEEEEGSSYVLPSSLQKIQEQKGMLW